MHTSPRRGHGRRGQCVCSIKLSHGTLIPIHCSCIRHMLRSSGAGEQACGMCITDAFKLEMHLSSNALRVGKLRQRADASLPPFACLGYADASLPSFGHAQLRQPKSGPQFILGMQLVDLDILGTAVYPLRSCSLSLVAIKVNRRVPAAIIQQQYERLYSQFWTDKDMLCSSKICGSGPRRS